MLGRIDRFVLWLETWSAILLLALIVLLVALASAARAIGSPVIWSVEVAQLLFVWLCILAADLAMRKGRHFGLTFLLDALPPRAARRLALVNHLVLAVLLGFLFVHAWRNMILMHPRLVGATQMNGSFIHASMVAGFALLLRTMLAKAWTLGTAAEAPGGADEPRC